MPSRKFAIGRGLALAGLMMAAGMLAACDTYGAGGMMAATQAILKLKPEERDAKLRGLSQDDRDALVRAAYGRNIVYLSPQSQAQLFESEENFIYGVLAGLTSHPLWPPFDKLPEDQKAKLAEYAPLMGTLPGIWQANMAALKAVSGSFVDARLKTIRERAGTGAYLIDKMDAQGLRDLIWDDTSYNRFMAEDQYALNYIGLYSAVALSQVQERDRAKRLVNPGILNDAQRVVHQLRDGLGPAAGASSRTGT